MSLESIIREVHLNRLAYVYYRQSSKPQVDMNTGSRDYQLAQVKVARRLGWKEDNIRMADKDAGVSGTSTAGRVSYQQMVRDLRAGLVGGILVAALDRAGRDDIELQLMLKDCALFDTLLIIDGTPIDLKRPGELLVQQVMAIFVGGNNANRRDAMRRGLVGKLAQGLAMSRPPAGFVVTTKGKWDFDPDPVVRFSIETAFRSILMLRSFPKVTRALREQGVQLPRRDSAGNLRFYPPDEHALLSIARNRNYTADYVYGRQRVDPRRGKRPSGKPRLRRASDDELHVVPNHHAGYITSEQFEEIQKIIEINRPSQDRRNMGCGTAILEGGLVRCATHRNHAMRVNYQVDDKGRPRWSYYICMGEKLEGGDGCGSVPGATLEPSVVRAVLDRLNVPRLETIRQAWDEARSTEGDEQHRREAELARARREVEVARRRRLAVDDEKYPQAAEEFTALLEQAKTHLKKIESLAALPPSTLSLFTNESWDQLLGLCEDRQALWDDDATTVHDKKELIRTLVEAVVIETLTRETVRGHVVWQDGGPDTAFELPRRDSVRKQILQLAAEGLRPREIAVRLNDLGVRNLQGHPWSAEAVARRIKEYQRRSANRADQAA